MTAGERWRLPRGRLAIVLAVLSMTGCRHDAEEGDPAHRPATPSPAIASSGEVKLCEHRVPEELCTRCVPELAAVFQATGDWCEEHAVPESQCFQCNPKLTFTAPEESGEPWCKEHAIVEAKCTQCNPGLVAKFVADGDFCREHGFPESACPFCHPEIPRAAGIEPPQFPSPDTVVRLARPELEAKAGIETVTASGEAFAESIEAVGRLDFDQTRFSLLSSPGETRVIEVKVDAGDRVRRGQALVTLASGARVHQAATRTRLENARLALEREESLLEQGISARRDVEAARAELAEAEAAHAEASAGLAGSTAPAGPGRYTLAAPFDGVVVSRAAVVGQAMSSGEPILSVADPSTLWAVLEAPEEAASRVRVGQEVSLRVDGDATREIRAKVSRVGAAIDAETRTVRVRVDLSNKNGDLKAGAFVRARIAVGEKTRAFLVPRDALQRAQGTDLVFVRTGEGVYVPRRVGARTTGDGRVALLDGVLDGERIVTTGAFLLKTEIMAGSIGAGCADGD